MSARYLFQIDGAKENDKFFEATRSSPSLAYKGVELKVGKGPWIPDLVQVEIDESHAQGVLTLIELEDKKPDALAGCRKYLPEDSRDILRRFNQYLDRIREECHSRADARGHEFARLKKTLGSVRLVVKTACALRSSTDIIEEWPLMDQPETSQSQGAQQTSDKEEGKEGELHLFHDTEEMSAKRAKAMGRCVMVLDAVIRGKDVSDATLHAWRPKSPLKTLLKTNDSPILRELFETHNTMLKLDFEALLSELLAIWQGVRPDLHREGVRCLISGYFPTALDIPKSKLMKEIFDTARRHLANTNLGGKDRGGSGIQS